MSEVKSDVVVVGGGPAGTFSAFQAAKLGCQVTICEEHSEVGDPSHCTGHISLSGLGLLNLHVPQKIFENNIRSATFYSPSGYWFRIQFTLPITTVINRTLFDRYLANRAVNAGAKISYSARCDSFIMKKGYVKGIVIKRRRKIEKLASNVVIDAEGVSSTLLKRAGLPSIGGRMIVNGAQAKVDRVDCIEDNVEVFFGRAFAPGFFAWIVPHHDGTAKVGLATIRGNPRDHLNSFIRHHPIARERLKRSRIESVVYHPIPLNGPIFKTFHNGLLVVGDAASHVKPTTGGGVVMGMTCAKIAGRVAAYAVQYKDSSAHFLSEYERQWKKKIGFDMLAMKRLRLLLNSLSDRQLDKLITLCSRLELDESLKNVVDTDFQGSSLIQLVKSPKVLTTMLYFLKLSILNLQRGF